MKASHSVLLLIEPWPSERFKGISRFARSAHWRVMMEDPRNPPPGWTGDGALVMMNADNPTLTDFVRTLRRRHIPVVDLICAKPDVRLPRVIGDNPLIGRLAAEHLAERGFGHVAFFSADWSEVHRLRFHGFNAAWRRLRRSSSRPFLLKWSDQADAIQRHDWHRLSRWLGDALSAAPKPLGIFAYADYDATLVLNACLEHGLSVPEEVAVLGVDNDLLLCENQAISISSVFHDLEQIGYSASELLEQLMSGDVKGTPTRLVPPRGVVLRNSTDTIAAEDPLVRKALLFVKGNLKSPLGVMDVASACDVGVHALNDAFKCLLHRSVCQEIQRQRLIAAKRFLTDTQLKISAIAEETGFCNAAYLTNVFRRQMFMTPLMFRKQTATPNQASS